jgi:hypothetical protein
MYCRGTVGTEADRREGVVCTVEGHMVLRLIEERGDMYCRGTVGTEADRREGAVYSAALFLTEQRRVPQPALPPRPFPAAMSCTSTRALPSCLRTMVLVWSSRRHSFRYQGRQRRTSSRPPSATDEHL